MVVTRGGRWRDPFFHRLVRSSWFRLSPSRHYDYRTQIYYERHMVRGKTCEEYLLECCQDTQGVIMK